jgi:hypothetical protein
MPGDIIGLEHHQLMLGEKVIDLGRSKHPRRFHGECQRCRRLDYLPWATEHGVRYCGHCWEADAISYTRAPGCNNT